MSFLTIIRLVWKYAPLISSIMNLIHQQESEAERQRTANELERGFRVLTETKDPTHLEAAIRSRCTERGCMLP